MWHQTNELVKIQVNGEQITSTPSHPFYVYNIGWTAASDLRAGDKLCKVNGEYVAVEMMNKAKNGEGIIDVLIKEGYMEVL